jgi:hypothetical protein
MTNDPTLPPGVLGPHPNTVSKGRPQMANPIHRKPSQRRIDSIVRRLAREKGDKASKP